MCAERRSVVAAQAGAPEEYAHEADPAAWVQRQVDKAVAAGRPHAVIVTVTPDLAAALLERNSVSWNRKLSAPLVNRYAGVMTRTEWKLNGESVILALTGELNNGQHRLTACIQCGVPFPTLIVFGIDRDTRSTLDSGKRRTIADELYMAGYTNVHVRASAASTVLGYLKKDVNILGYGGASTAQILTVLQDHPRLMEGHGKGVRVHRAFKGSVGVFTALHYLFSMRSKDAADHFFDTFVNSFGIKSPTDSRSRLAVKLRDHRLRRHHMQRAEMVAATIKAWNYWCRGESCPPLHWRAMGGTDPLPTIDEWTEVQDALLAKALQSI